MPNGTGINRSAAGSRGYLQIGAIGVMPRYSTASIALNNFVPQSHNYQRTWWVVDDFDNCSNPDEFYILPCDTVNFKLGDELYKSAEDAVPGAMRVRASRCGSYSYKISFPLLANVGEHIYQAYSLVNSAVQRANYMLALHTSIQNRYYPCVIENFSISVDGYGGANPVSCQLSVKGISNKNTLNTDFTSRSILENQTIRDKSNRIFNNKTYFHPDIEGVDPSLYGGRFANIKDCSMTIGDNSYKQIVSMQLDISNQIILKSVAKDEPSIPTIKSSDRVFIVERTVKGSFKFLSSYSSEIDLSATLISDQTMSDYSLAERSSDYPQWASPISMSFGPNMDFSMPAAYWQPRTEDLNTGSPLITIDFIARSNVLGVNEFMSGLSQDY